MKHWTPCLSLPSLAALCAALATTGTCEASTAYGTLNNFDTVNDTEPECHGFEIELEDLDSPDVSHTYNYNHYGVPKIEVDRSDAAHPVCKVRWESAKNPDGSWAAYTAIPAGPIDPTNGHQFTNPNVNFGGEHFGVGYRKAPTVVRYYWLIDDDERNWRNGEPDEVEVEWHLLQTEFADDEGGGGFVFEWEAGLPGWVLEESPDSSPGSWILSEREIQNDGESHRAIIAPTEPIDGRFYRLSHP